MTKLSDYVMQFIADRGVKHVFMLPGGGAMHLNDALGRCKALTYVCNLHEQASAIAAENYSKVTGNLGVAMVTTGPGGTNAITGVAGAWLDSTPMLIVSGQVKRADLKRDTGVRINGVQEVDIVSIVKPITKYAVLVLEPRDIRYHLEKAVYLAKTGRPGPVWIDIPLDVQASPIDVDSLHGFDPAELQDRTAPSAAPKTLCGNRFQPHWICLNEPNDPCCWPETESDWRGRCRNGSNWLRCFKRRCWQLGWPLIWWPKTIRFTSAGRGGRAARGQFHHPKLRLALGCWGAAGPCSNCLRPAKARSRSA